MKAENLFIILSLIAIVLPLAIYFLSKIYKPLKFDSDDSQTEFVEFISYWHEYKKALKTNQERAEQLRRHMDQVINNKLKIE